MAAAGHHRGAALDGVGHVGVHLERARLVVHRPHGRGVVERVAEPAPALDLARESETNSSRTASWTRMRSAAEQLWPAPRKEPTRAASARPQIRVVEHDERAVAAHLDGCALPAAWRATISPVSVEPVNATAWVPGLTASPAFAPARGRARS